MKNLNQKKEWEAVAILQETRGKYLIQWAGIDPITKQPCGNKKEWPIKDWWMTSRRGTKKNGQQSTGGGPQEEEPKTTEQSKELWGASRTM